MKLSGMLGILGLIGCATVHPPRALAHAMGGETSGGGAILRTANNPWFVSDLDEDITKLEPVHYCIEADRRHFGNVNHVRAQVSRALDAWRAEMKLENKEARDGTGWIGVMQEQWIEGPCAENTDVRFLFGNLPLDVSDRLDDPSRYIALSYRTSYDERTLRAKGFIYVAPGNQTWSDPDRLFWVLFHEMGHVLGLGHTLHGVMAESFPEDVAAGSYPKVPNYERGERFDIFSLNLPGKKWKAHSWEQGDYFSGCDAPTFVWSNPERAEAFCGGKLIGHVTAKGSLTIGDGGVYMWIPPGHQRRFARSGWEGVRYGARYRTEDYRGEFVSLTGERRPLWFQTQLFQRHRIRMLGIRDDKFIRIDVSELED